MPLTPQQLIDLPHNTPVRVIESYCSFLRGDIIYRCHEDAHDCGDSCYFSSKPDGEGIHNYMTYNEVELIVEEAPSAVAVCSTIARPVLEERKIGKIAIELFDEGFPNAVMAVSEVMTWAAEHKGYKPHDWKHLPQAETAFLAAGSRHRVKRHIQTAEGLSPAERVDDESKLLHLAHEAFNVLAQLELTLTGKIA